jgi:hypothetical protein
MPSVRTLLVLILFALSARPAPSAPVEADHPVYAFLRKLQMRGVVAPGGLATLPRPKEEIAALLDEAEASPRLHPLEKARIVLFRKQLNLAPPAEAGYRGRFRPLTYSDSDAYVSAGLEYFTGGYAQDSIPKAQAYAFGSLNATVEGAYKRKLQFVSTAGIAMERSHYPRFVENYDPQRGLPYNTDREGKAGKPRSVSTMDAFRTVVGWRDEDVRLELGSDWNQWGPGVWQHAFLSQRPWQWVQDSLPGDDSSQFPGTPYPGRYRRGFRYPGEGAPMTQARAGYRLGWLEYTKVVGARQGLWTDSSAYMVAHRLEARPWPFLGIGLQELVVTAGRSLDWTYVIPLVPLKFAEHELGDRDNSSMGFDVEALWAGRGRAYGELLLDDFSGWDPEFWGNKFAFTVGAEAVDFPFAGSLLQAEYSRVEAWTFTHTRLDGQLQHFGGLLGSSLPPNSHALHLAWEQPLPAAFDVRLEYLFMQRDAASRGSSIFDHHIDALDGSTKSFLGGVVETRNAITLAGTWRFDRFVELRAAAGFLSVDNWKSRQGSSLSWPTASGEVYLRY